MCTVLFLGSCPQRPTCDVQHPDGPDGTGGGQGAVPGADGEGALPPGPHSPICPSTLRLQRCDLLLPLDSPIIPHALFLPLLWVRYTSSACVPRHAKEPPKGCKGASLRLPKGNPPGCAFSEPPPRVSLKLRRRTAFGTQSQGQNDTEHPFYVRC